MDYSAFLDAKRQLDADSGFEPIWMPEWLFDFQRSLVEWSLRRGRAAIFADCGLGKTPMQLVWAENVVRHTNRPVLLLTPLAVSHQTLREADKFAIDCERSQDGTHNGSRIVVTNYQRLHYFDPNQYAGIVCDESSVLKNFNAATRKAVTEFSRRLPYRLLCTATAAPNDYFELGTSSEALGHLGFQDMLTRFFKQDVHKDYLGWGRTIYRFRGHAEQPFWQWVCSWARACRKPSDLGFDDLGFTLPPLDEREMIIECSKPQDGMLFTVPARTMQEQRNERRETISERCEAVCDSVTQHDGSSVSWCHLNDEADRLERIIPDALQVSGSMPDEVKEERLIAFQDGELKRLITKPKIGCFGLNWQHCHYMSCFPSHSWEQYYQAVRRCWRFGQEQPVTVQIVTTEGEIGVLRNLQRKANQSSAMFDKLTTYIGRALHIEDIPISIQEEIPSWL
jgi:hypothetical protein